ncbi:MAG TPA: M56 family metallopeptidase [Acidobacteriaceae bacterium]|nr:M56 family metallopeptidase [Acidobacteriaceae bacterium]
MIAAALGVWVLPGWSMAAASAAVGGLIAAVWQGILLSVLVVLGLRLFPKAPAGVRFAVWFGVFVVVAAMPLAGLLQHGAAAEGRDRSAWLMVDARWCVLIAAIWAMASAVRAVTLLLAVARVRTLWKRATPLDFKLRDLEMSEGLRLAQRAGSRHAELCVSDELDRPAVIGFFAPRILIPSWLVEKMTAEELEQVVLHESMHLSRADDWMNLLQKAALVVFPLNPALAWLERKLCFERELACDERVLDATGAPKAYAACLASLAEHRLGRRGLALALGVVGRESELGQRVRRILSRSETMRPGQVRLVLGGAMIALVASVAGLVRCPPVVGFATRQEVAASAPVRVDGALHDGFGYQAVVFHPEAASGSMRTRAVPTHARKVGLQSAKQASARTPFKTEDLQARFAVEEDVTDVARGMSGTRPTLTASAPDGLVSQPVSAKEARNGAQWVIVTTWRGGDGSSMVLTTVHAADSAMVRLGLRGDGSVAKDQFHPYAAVPVQDGWLLFEL